MKTGKVIAFICMAIIISVSAVYAADNSSVNNNGQLVVQDLQKGQCNATPAELAGIIKAIEYYVDAGIKGDSKIAAKGFIPAATMSWSENNTLKTVPIKALYDFFDEKPRSGSCKLVACNVANDIAIVRLETESDGVRYTDMFSLVKDGNDWKIVSKVYHLKK